MWLLDANLPLQLVALLRGLGVESDSAVARGWNTLSNGRLVEAAVKADLTDARAGISFILQSRLAESRNRADARTNN